MDPHERQWKSSSIFLFSPRGGRGGGIGGVRLKLGEAEAMEVFGVHNVTLMIPAGGVLDGGDIAFCWVGFLKD